MTKPLGPQRTYFKVFLRLFFCRRGFEPTTTIVKMLEDDPYTRKERKDRLIGLMESGEWSKILSEFDEDPNYREPLLVWVRPSIEMLKFIEAELAKLNINKALELKTMCPYLET